MVETVDPRKVLKDAVKLLDYEPLNLTIKVSLYDFSIDDSHYYRITKQDGRLNFVIENSSLNIDSVDTFLKTMSYYGIEEIIIENGVTETLLFECGLNLNCMDYQRAKKEYSTKKIQKNFRKSREYAAWKYSPERLKQQGYFNTEFGKKRSKNFIQEANARSRRKGTMGTFGRWCRRNKLDVDGKVSLRCINKAKRSGNTKLIRRAVYAQNIKAYAGARKKRSTSFGKRRKTNRKRHSTKRNLGSEEKYLRSFF
jgi:hypothetical protein